jgi:hypothetical protein
MAEGRLSDSGTALTSVNAVGRRSMLRWRMFKNHDPEELKNNDSEELEQKLRTVNPAFSKRALKGLHRHDGTSKQRQSTSIKTKKVLLSAPTANRKPTSRGGSTTFTNQKSGNKSTTTLKHGTLGSIKDKSTSSKRIQPSTAAGPISSDISPAPTTKNTNRPSSPKKARTSSSTRVYGPPSTAKNRPLPPTKKQLSSPAQRRPPSSTQNRPSSPPANKQVTMKSGQRPSSQTPQVRPSQGTKKTSISYPSRYSMERQGGQVESRKPSQASPSGATRNAAVVESHPKTKQTQRQANRSRLPGNNGRERSLANFVSGPSARKVETRGVNQADLLFKPVPITSIPMLQKVDCPNNTVTGTSLSSRLKKIDGPEQTLAGIVPPNASARAKRRAAVRRMLEEKEQADAAPIFQLDNVLRPVISLFTCEPPSAQSILSNCTPCACTSMKFNLDCCNAAAADDDESIICGSTSRKSALLRCGNDHDSATSYSSTLYSCGNDQSTTCGTSTASTLHMMRCGQEEQSSTDSGSLESSQGQNSKGQDSEGQETSLEVEEEKPAYGTISKNDDSVTVIPLHTAAILLKAAAFRNGGKTPHHAEGDSIDSSIVEEEVWSQGGRNKYSRQVLLQTFDTETTDSKQPDEEEVYTVGGKNRYSRQASNISVMPEAISLSGSSSSTISESTDSSSSSGMSASLYDL